MRLAPRAAIAVGVLPDDPVKEAVEELAGFYGFKFYSFDALEGANEYIDSSTDMGTDRMFVLLCTKNLSEGLIEQHIAELIAVRESVQIVVYDLSGERSGDSVLDCIKAGAYDYLVYGSYEYEELKEQIKLAMRKRPSHPPFKKVPRVEAGSYVFIATPYMYQDARDDYNDGITAALERLNISYLTANEEYWPSSLQGKVCEQIVGSTLVIANITRYGRCNNANVYLEIGYSMGKGKPVILVKGAKRHKIPSDIQGLEYLEYSNPAELALKLYFGLK